MPKLVDHRARRTSIAEALMRVAADRGLEAVSLRHVAAEAGVSAGMVQHYFRTKDEMMTFAWAVISEQVQARLAARAQPASAARGPRATVQTLLVELLPLDAQRRLEGHVGLAFHAYAAVRPELASQLGKGASQLRQFVTDQIRADSPSGPADPDTMAASLLAVVEGLTLQVLTGSCTAELAMAVLDAQLDSAFPGR
jgi:AcrR family transcriptional regulator